MNDEPETIEAEPTVSLRDELAANMAAAEERESAEPEPEPAPAADAPADGTVPEPEPRDDGRDAAGRFAAKPKEGETPPEGEQEPAAAAEPVPDGDAPSSWRESAKAAWANIPPDARAEILRRERDVESLRGRVDTERRFGMDMAEIVRPHMETIKGFGISPQFAVQTLLNNDRIMRFGKPEEKLSLARRMITDYGMDPAVLSQPDPNFSSDPLVRNLQVEFAQLKQRVVAPQQQNVAPLPQPEPDAMQQEIGAFRTDPAHPHFDQVAPVMVALFESGAASSLQDAYDQAVWSNPTLRSTLQAQTSPQEAQRTSQATKTAAARRADVSVSGSPGAAGTAKPTTLRDELREQFRQHGIE